MDNKLSEVLDICIFVLSLVALFAFLVLIGFALIYDTPTEQPLLVGYGCEGTSGPIYAYEESDFPFCDSIERRIGE